MNPFAPPARLSRAQIEITTACTLACAGCQRTLALAEGRWVNAHMPVDRFRRVIDHLPPAAALVVQGIGEPTLHPRLPDLLTLARDSGKFGQIGFNTNGLTIAPAGLAALRRHGLSHLSLSVDSLIPAEAERCRAGTDCDRLRRTIAALSREFDRALTLSVTVSRDTVDALGPLLAELVRLGAVTIEIQPLIVYRPSQSARGLESAQAERVRTIVAAARRRHPGVTVILAAGLTPTGARCRRPLTAAYVTVDGLLTPCCVTEEIEPFGHANIEETPFDTLWRHEPVAAWFSAYLDQQPAFCRDCGLNPAGTPHPTAADGRAALADAIRAFEAGRTDLAGRTLRALLGDETTTDALHQLGLIAWRGGDPAGALPLLHTAHGLRPTARAANNLAAVLARQGQEAAAIALLRETLARTPHYIPAYHTLAALLRAAGETDAAGEVIARLIRQAAQAGDMARVETELPRLSELAGQGGDLPLTANIIRTAGRPDLAARLLDDALPGAADPIGTRLSHAVAQLAVCYPDDGAVRAARQRYNAALEQLERDCAGATTDALARAAAQVGNAKPFYLAYQGEDDHALQRRYGGIVHRIIAAADPVAPPPPPPTAPGQRMRIGFVSAYFRRHSIAKTHGGWLRRLDRRRFEILAYDLSGGDPDAWTRALHLGSDQVRRGLGDDRAWARAIAADRPHALIYPELGMQPLALMLACRRLAPVQCNGLGHPVTSGLPTIDYALSSALMEPEDGGRHYSEQLVRLPNLSFYYDPQPDAAAPMRRDGLGLRPDAVVYVCCQSLFKFQPRHDSVFTRIAAAEPRSQFLFIADSAAPATAIFRDRLRAVFRAAGLSFDRHAVLVDPVPPDQFPAFLRLGDIFLDNPGWSGCNTALEAATVGLPLVTWPGPMMRARHTAAMLWRMGLADHVSPDLDAYVARAVALADPARRTEAAAAIAAGRHRLFHDEEAIAALGDFLETAIRGGGTTA